MIFNSILYVQLEGFAALVLFIIMDHGKNRLMNLSQRLFKLQLCLTIAVLLLDAATWVLNGRIFPGAHTICLAVNQLYWFLSILPCYVGFLYCMSMICGRVDRLWGLLAAVPVAVGALFLILNFQNGWIFTVSDTNVYTRGPYFLIVGSMPFLHMAAAVVLSAVRYFRAQIYERKLYIMLMFFMLFPLVGSILQVLWYGLVTIWIGLTLSMLMCYVYIQNGTLATDALTGLNNRWRFDAYSAWLWENRREQGEICLMVLDIDRFKSINDACGHVEGDLALIRASNVLKAAMAERKGFLARIGGDEFAILLTHSAEPDAAALARQIHQLLDRSNTESGSLYQLSVSIGYSFLQEDDSSFRTLFSRSDQEMYRQKSLQRR
jgi:diguanylate cyclase (GGDEF)-like protein